MRHRQYLVEFGGLIVLSKNAEGLVCMRGQKCYSIPETKRMSTVETTAFSIILEIHTRITSFSVILKIIN